MDGQLAAWQTQTLRLTAFPSPSAAIVQPSWWRDLRGEEPESRSSQPRKGGFKEEGPFADGKLILNIEPLRIHWVYAPIDDEKQQAEGFSTIGTLQDTITTFTTLMNSWFELDTCPPVQRLAFGVVMLQPVQDSTTGYRLLRKYLSSMPMDVDNIRDFLYQINWRRDSRVIPDLQINRLSKWSVATLQTMTMQMAPEVTPRTLGPRHHACRLELDINTMPEFKGEFVKEQLSPIFKELIDLGVEIAYRGDVP